MITLNQIKKRSLARLQHNKIPETPGVYVFWLKSKPLYIGKAINLKNRVKSYFSFSLAPKTKRMIEEAEEISYIKVTSEIEALLLEAKLIRKFQPRYNSAAKDDKHPLYIQITKEEYPRVVTARKIAAKEPSLAFYGPFPSSKSVRGVLKFLRRIFPYADHKLSKRPCLYSHIGLCNPCPSAIERQENQNAKEKMKRIYKQNIIYIKAVLSGKFKKVKNDLYKEMLNLAKNEEFEKAAYIREQIRRLDYITQVQTPASAFLENPNLFEDIRKEEIKDLKKLLSPYLDIKGQLLRIECFDVAHLFGAHPTASMVTFIEGEAEKNFYRHFRIRQVKGQDDISSMKEVARRRSKYLSSWGEPDLIIVDGGKTQVGAFMQVFGESNIPVIGLAKQFETIVIPIRQERGFKFIQKIVPKGPSLNILQRIRDEAHRFARRYHHFLLKKSLLGSLH